jgi:hypothetical protein
VAVSAYVCLQGACSMVPAKLAHRCVRDVDEMLFYDPLTRIPLVNAIEKGKAQTESDTFGIRNVVFGPSSAVDWITKSTGMLCHRG